MKITLDLVKELRQLTACSIGDCRKALEDTKGDVKQAQQLLRKKGLEIAEGKKDRSAKEGRVSSYIHLGGKIGVLVQINCETDFVAKNEDFIAFGKDISMQIAASSPKYTAKEDVPKDILDAQPDRDMFIKSACLLEQEFIKNPSIIIKDYLGELVAKIGENISIARFVRFSVKEGITVCGAA